jgi:anti-sigma28 factor (negative regulator of flagellin synthesis)
MKTTLSALALLASVVGYAHAQSEVFVCINENGTKEYKNTGTTKGCKRVDLQGITMIPSPYKKPVVQTAAARPSTNTTSEFPKVDSGTQKARDNDRMQILTDELKSEEQKLANLKKEFNNGEPERRGDERNFAKYQERVLALKEDVNRSEKNIEALKREIGNLK